MSTSSRDTQWQLRRGKARQLKQYGWQAGAIAVALHVNAQIIAWWTESYQPTTKHGNHPTEFLTPADTLNKEQQHLLYTLLHRLPSDFGFQAQHWSAEHVRMLIQQLFDLSLEDATFEQILQSMEKYHQGNKTMEHPVQQLTVKQRHRIHKLQLWALDHLIQETPSHEESIDFIPEQSGEVFPTGHKKRRATLLHSKFKAGPPTKLTMEQLQTLPELLLKPPHAYGFTGTVWTYKQIALLIEQVFHVSFSPDYIPDFLKRARRRLEKWER